MNKRKFLTAAALGASAFPAMAQKPGACQQSPNLLTVTGAIGRGNRGPFDPVLDQMMGKQKISFDKAHAFDFAALAALPAITIRPALEYDARPHRLRGPLLANVLKAAGALSANASKLLLRAVDGYAPVLTMTDVRKYKFIVATHLDGKPMPLGGFGPLWAIYDADRFADMAAKPLPERFAQCPWGLYHIEVMPG